MTSTNFLGGSYQSRSLPLAAQTLVNLFFEGAPSGSAEEGMFFGAPGRRLLLSLGNDPVRGQHTAFGWGWVVAGTSFYKVSSAGASTLIGTVPGTGRVSMVNNDTQLVIMHDSGWKLLATADATSITDVAGAPTTAQGTYQDSYIIFPQLDGTYGWTPIDDASTVDALNFASAEAQPDPVISTLSVNRELWLFGQQTVEIAQTSTDPDLPFTRTSIMEYGCCAKFSPSKSNNTVFWLGQNESGLGMVFQAVGYTPSRISTHALETAIATYGDISSAFGFCYQQNGHTYYVLTFPGFATWVWDASTQRWTQLVYFNATTGARERQRDNAYMFLGGQHIVGDYANGNLYVLDLDTYTDNGNLIERERAWAVIENQNKWIRHNYFELIGEMGVGLDGISAPTPGATPKWRLAWSDNGCRSFSNERDIDMGKIGQYRKRGIIRHLGLSRRRVYRLRTTEPVRIAVYGVNIAATKGIK